MAVITISRELGSLGRLISRQVTQELGYPHIDKDIIAHILHQYGLVTFDRVYDTAPGLWERLDSMNYEVITMLNKVILAFAQQDNILIQGRGGYAVLKDFDNVINIRIQAPLNVRAQRVMERNNIKDFISAQEFVKLDDKIRKTFMHTYYDTAWNDTNAFHLVFDTSKVSTENIAQWIISAVEEIDGLEKTITGHTKFINVDPVLAKTIQDVFKTEPTAS